MSFWEKKAAEKAAAAAAAKKAQEAKNSDPFPSMKQNQPPP